MRTAWTTFGAATADMVMDGQRFWITAGRTLEASPPEILSDSAETARFDHDGAVRVTIGSMGTEIKWSVFSPCFASLFNVMKTLRFARLPIVLRFYLSGWFEEVCATSEEAIDRIEQVISKSEIHLTKRAFVEEIDPNGKKLPPMLQHIWKEHRISPETSVDFVYEEQSRKFRVERIGLKSTIAKYYGVTPLSYPYVNGGSYNDIVDEAYTHVLRSGKSRYDHVLAAMRMPDNIVRWVPYQRIVVPKLNSENLPCVSVVTEIANVDIRPI